jgi:hypothetical protein
MEAHRKFTPGDAHAIKIDWAKSNSTYKHSIPQPGGIVIYKQAIANFNQLEV